MIPSKIFFTKGMGRSKKELESFEIALRDAGIAEFNLVQVSSILPPRCVEVTKEEGLKYLSPGQIVYVVLSRNSNNEKSRLISASVGVAKPKDNNSYGYISEHHAFGQDHDECSDFAEDLAATMLATTLGIPFDPEADYDERREIYMMSDKIVETKSITACTEVEKENVFTTVIAAAVLIE